MPKDSVFSMAFGFPRSVSQLTTDVQQLSKECNSCNSNFNELRKEIRETQSAPPQASTKRITNLTKQKNEKKKKTQKTWITDHEAKKEILRAFLCQVPNGKDDDTLVALAMNEILEIFSEAGENSKYSNGSFAKARTFCRLKDGQRERRFTCQEPVSSNGTPSPTPFPSPEKACASFWWCRHCLKMTSVSAYSLCCWEYHLSSSRKSVIRVKFEGCAREREQIQPACSSTASSSTASSSTASSSIASSSIASSSIASSSIASSSIASSSIASSSIARTHCWHLAVNSVFASCWQKWKRGSRSAHKISIGTWQNTSNLAGRSLNISHVPSSPCSLLVHVDTLRWGTEGCESIADRSGESSWGSQMNLHTFTHIIQGFIARGEERPLT